MSSIMIAKASDFFDGEMKSVTVKNEKLLIVSHAGVFYAYEDKCCHLGVALSKGKLADNVLTCFAHHWQYDVTSGKSINPTGKKLHEYKISLVGDDLWVELNECAEVV